MDDDSALILALDVARAFKAGERSPLDAARTLTSIVNPWRSWWTELGGANGPLSALYAADEAAMKLHWLGDEVEGWHPDVRKAKRMELREAEDKWREPVEKACDVLIRYGQQE